MGELIREVIRTASAPGPIGPYSQAVRSGGLLFVSGMLGLVPSTGEMVLGGIQAETRQALSNLQAILEAGSSSLALVVKTTVFLRDMADFPLMNSVYGEFLTADPPARSTVQVAALPRAAAIEIEAVALVG
ncbi:MAG TPA: Rid family detoxifying hydrolase [Anaerolineales bacterium]|nr:Rid family detoxifying hydrolase [Anaerolineales bacterium]